VAGVNSAPGKVVEPVVIVGMLKENPLILPVAALSVIVPVRAVELLSAKVPDTAKSVSACAGRTGVNQQHITRAPMDNERDVERWKGVSISFLLCTWVFN
jgi:hypothetical protein